MRMLFALAAMLCSAQAFAAVDLALNNDDTGFDPVPAGGLVEYRLEVINAGSSLATGVVLTDTLPANVDYVGSTGGSCAAPVGGVLTCNLGSLAAYGGTAVVVVRVRTTVAGSITNSASVVSNEPDADTANNLGIAQGTTVNAGADLALTLTPNAADVPAGGTLGYTLTVVNNGPDTASSVRVSGNLPPDFKVSGGLPAGCSASGQALTCNVPGGIAVGGNHAFGLVNGVIGAGGGSNLTFAASVSVSSGSAPQDPVSTNNTAAVTTPVTSGSDVSIDKTASAGPVVLTGTAFNYILATKYTGDIPLNLVVTDTIPANFEVLSPASFTSNGWACTVSGQSVNCSRANGGSAAGADQAMGDIVIQVMAKSIGNGIINTASISSSTADPNPTNNASQATLTLMAPTTDLAAKKSGPSPALASAGVQWSWTIQLENKGPAALVGQAVMTDTLPLNLIVHSYAPNGWSCLPAAPFTTSAGNQAISCTRDYSPASPLASGASAPAVSYAVSAAVDGAYNNTMCVSAVDSGGNTAPVDPDNSNNCDGSNVTVQPMPDSADLQLFKSGSPGSLFAGDELTYTLEIVNVGPSTAANVVLSDTLDNLINNQFGPADGLVNVAASAGNSSGSTCSTTAGPNRRALSCPFTSVPVCTKGADCPVVTVVVRPGGDGGPRTNIADAVSNTTADPNYANNGASATTAIIQRPDVTVTKTATPNAPVAGQALVYTVTAHNNGPSKADGVSIDDTLPLDVTFVSAVASGGGSCPTKPVAGATVAAGNRQLKCQWTSLGNTLSQTVKVTVRPNTVTRDTSIVNDVSIATTTPDESNYGNNTATVTVAVAVPVLDLIANVTDNPNVVAVGDEMVYTLKVANDGPSYAENVTLTDALPVDKLSFVSATPTVGSCSTVPAVGSFGQTLVCNVGGLASGASTTVALRMKGEVKGSTSTTLTVSSDETVGGFDSIPANNIATETTTVIPKADVEVVSKTAVPGTVGLREAFTYQIAVHNNGPGVADGAALTDSLPAGMQLHGVPTVAPGNAGDFPSLGVCTGTIGDASFSCALGDDVAIGASATITVPVIIVTPLSSNPGTLSNTATISTTSRDEVPGNNSKTGAVTVQTASLAGRVYGDVNDNGILDAGETGLAGVSVTIDGIAPDGTPVSFTKPTDLNGNYLFDKLPAGTYTVTEIQPAGWLDGKDSAGTAGGTAAVPGDAISGIVLLKATVATGYNFGELKGGTISGTVYRDLNNDGVIGGAGETGIGSVTLSLSGTDDRGNPVTATTTSDGSGNYSFGNLRPGTYKVTETPPAGFLPGKATAGSGTTAGGTAAADGDAIDGIILEESEQGTAFNFGELPPTGLSGVVYVDANRDGLHDAAETAGVAGVTITLSGTDDLGAPVSLTTTTDAAGAYHFDNLRPGTYQIVETQPALWDNGGTNVGMVGGALRGNGAVPDIISAIVLAAGETGIGYDFGERGQGLGGFVYVDLNENGARDAGEPGIAGVTLTATNLVTNATATAITDASGAYLFNNLPAGSYSIGETQPAKYKDGAEAVGSLGGALTVNDVIGAIPLGVAQVGTNYNFGELAASIAGSTYVDLDGNGVRDSGEPGIPGVTVVLGGTDIDGNPVNVTLTSDASGHYKFTGLLPSDPSGYTLTETQPPAYADGTEKPGSLGGTPGAAGTSVISGIPVGPGANGSGYDFGELTGGIAGVVYADANNDGVRDPGETGIGGVSVRLTGTDIDGKPVDVTVATGADGSYAFAGLTKADATGYTITETQPATYLDGKAVPGMVDGAACAACNIGTINRIAGVPFDPGQNFAGFNFPELLPSSLAGSVYDDIDGNHRRDTGEGLGGVTVTLTGTDDLGNPVTKTTVTAEDGSYQFDNLRPGTYAVEETQPPGLADVGTQAGTVGGSTAINTITAITLPPGTAATGYDFIDHGSLINGVVYFDKNGNGQQDAGEPGLAGITVTLSGTASRTLTTDATGHYQFAGLVAGTYAVSEAQPPLYKDGGVQLGSAGGVAGTNTISAIVLAAGVNGIGYHFPELTGADGSIAGTAWLNQAGGNLTAQDPGETGLAGWFVELYKDGARVPGVERAITDASGRYLLTGVPATTGYEIRFLSPNGTHYGQPVSQDADPQWNGTVDKAAAIPAISGVTVGSGVAVIRQDLPVDPSGIVYDSVTRQPLAGVRVTLLDPTGQPVAPQHLAGGATNGTQTTGPDGYYHFLLLPGAPSGNYTVRIEQPAGYLPAPSGIHAPASNGLTVPAGNTPYHVSHLPGPPATGDLPAYYLGFVVTPLSAGITGNHLPLDPVLQGALRVTKTTPKINVTKGDLVPYTIEITNTLAVPLANIAARDLVPAGFKYRNDSARIDGVAHEPLINGRELSWPELSFAPNQVRSVQLVLVIGSGVGEGEYVNQAWAQNTLADRLVSNIGSAAVRIVPDPTFDCADLIGKVFDDKNGNGYQDQGEPGVPAVRVVTARGLLVTTDDQGRYHIPCAAVPEHARGANFVIKLDERSLPTGYRLTTENPGDVRVTAGKMAKLNFGVTIHRVLRVDVNAAAFEADGKTLLSTWAAQLPKLYANAQGKPSLVRIAYHLADGEDRGRAQQRVNTLRKQIISDWNTQGRQYPLQVEQEIIEVQP
ncbi:MAG TPA: SdrD B-like domain-containing protein [Rhodanobacter sp.]|nr:SdrD B-like domain-containing protein [Rhodanobacter sp.]